MSGVLYLGRFTLCLLPVSCFSQKVMTCADTVRGAQEVFMLCIYVELPYYYQLTRIFPADIESLCARMKRFAVHNGAALHEASSVRIFAFEAHSLGSVYAAVRCVRALYQTLDTYEKQVKEFRILMDVVADDASPCLIEDRFYAYRSTLIPDRGFFASFRAKQLLKHYLEFLPLPALNIYQVNGFLSLCAEKPFPQEVTTHCIVVRTTSSYMSALCNFMALHPLSEAVYSTLSEETRAFFFHLRAAVSFFKRRRYDSSFPQYLTDAFLQYVGLYFKLYYEAAPNAAPPPIYVDPCAGHESQKQAEKVLIVSPHSPLMRLPASCADIEAIPQDLAEVMYTLSLASRYIFADEIEEFFLFLKKHADFVGDLFDKMFCTQVTMVPHNAYAIPEDVHDSLEKRVRVKMPVIRECISSFLWKKYQEGSLCASTDLLRTFQELQYKYTSDCVLHSLFHTYSDVQIAHLQVEEYTGTDVGAVLKVYQHTLLVGMREDAEAAFREAKACLTTLQARRFVSAEYRTFSLLGFLTIGQSKFEDALVYFGYALDDAEQLRDGDFLCSALFHLSITYFLQHNFTQARLFLSKLSDAISTYFEQRWKTVSLFMQGRISLSLGEYAQARRCFDEAADFALQYFEHQEPLCRVWAAHARLLADKSYAAHALFQDMCDQYPDAYLFLVESYVRAEYFDDPTLFQSFPEETTSREPCVPSFSLDTPIYSGFSCAEDLVWGRQCAFAVSTQHSTVFAHYYHCRVHLHRAEDMQTFHHHKQKLEAIARRAFQIGDPSAALFLYLCYDVSYRVHGAEAAVTTAHLSRAFKVMQRSVAYMSENTVRAQFMQDNFWNAKLFAAAQANKLI